MGIAQRFLFVAQSLESFADYFETARKPFFVVLYSLHRRFYCATPGYVIQMFQNVTGHTLYCSRLMVWENSGFIVYRHVTSSLIDHVRRRYEHAIKRQFISSRNLKISNRTRSSSCLSLTNIIYSAQHSKKLSMVTLCKIMERKKRGAYECTR